MSVNLWTLAGFALRALRANKLRSSLTMLGIVIGVASVILIISLGEGLQKEINGIFNTVSLNSITVWSNSNNSPLTVDNGEAIARLPAVDVAVPFAGSSEIPAYQDQRWPMYVYGTTPDELATSTQILEEGRFISETDVLNASPYVVIGQRPYEKLFPPGTDPVGEEIKIRGMSFKVIGLLRASGASTLLEDLDNVMYMPITTVKQRLLGADDDNVDYLWVQVANGEDLDLATEEIRALLENRHPQLTGSAEDATSDYGMRTMEGQLSQVTTMTSIVTLFLSAIAGISLLVGGIGIMNIMLVSVTERTREIGVRMAIGASEKDILIQFLVEAVLLSLAGCLAGMSLGIGIGKLFGWLVSWTVPVSFKGIALSVGFSSMVGILFGFYPARRAARLNPAEALAYE